MIMHEITLDGYAAQCAEQPIRLGTEGSYGVETLRVIRKSEWVDYDIIVAFHPPKGESVQIRLESDNVVSVPAEATAVAGTGELTFAGYTDGVRQISVSRIYRVAESAGTEGIAPAEPTPDVVQQILSAARNAEEIAKSVRDDAEKIKERLDEIPKIDDTAITTTSPWSSKQIVDTLCPPIEETGNPVVCYPVAGYPLGVKAKWEPVQEGSGTPNPENIRPIKGRDSVTVERKEDGLTRHLTFSSTINGGEVDAVNGEVAETWGLVTLDGAEKWTVEGKFLDNKTDWYYVSSKIPNAVNAAPQKSNEICSHYPHADVANTNTVQGCAIVWGCIRVRWGDTIPDDADAWKAYLAAQYAARTPVQIAYKLAKPVSFTATGAQPIPALAGANTLLTDADSVSVSGRADLIHIIRKMQEK